MAARTETLMAQAIPSPGPIDPAELHGTVERLSRQLHSDRGRIEQELTRELNTYRDARIMQFVMLLAERNVRRRLRDNSHNQKTA
jgi:Protein of unknown function (DUF3562)